MPELSPLRENLSNWVEQEESTGAMVAPRFFRGRRSEGVPNGNAQRSQIILGLQRGLLREVEDACGSDRRSVGGLLSLHRHADPAA